MQLNIKFSDDLNPGFTDIEDINSSFAKGKLKVMYLGKNRNGSSIEKEAVLKALPSLYNVPVVANYMREEDEIGGHDIDVIRKGEELALVNITQPCGVIPEHCKFHFEIEMDSSGEAHEYLVADDVIIWKRQEIYESLMNRYEGKIAHSMEITVRDGFFNEQEESYKIEDFEFTALCLLGNCEPCFEGSALEMKEMSFSASFNQMLAEMKECLAQLNQANEPAVPSQEADENDTEMKGGEEMNTEEVKVEETLEEEFEEEVIEEINEPEPAIEEPAIDTDKVYELIKEAINENANYWMLHTAATEDSNKFTAMVQSKEDMKAYAVNATYSEDNLVMDWDNPIGMAYAVVSVDAPESYAMLPGMDEMRNANKAFSDKVVEFENQLNDLNTELTALRDYKAQIENTEAEAARAELLNRFTDLEGVEEFEALKDTAADYELSVLEDKLYAIRGRRVQVENFNVKHQVGVRIGVGSKKPNDEYEPYGNLFKNIK